MDEHLDDVVRPSGSAVAVWDLDGTLTSHDTLRPFLAEVAGSWSLTGIVVRSALRSWRGGHRRDRFKWLVLHGALAGRDAQAVDRIAAEYAEKLRQRLRPDCVRRWQWHHLHGHYVILASASPDLYLRHLGRLMGADAVICTRMEIAGGVLTGRMAGANCRGPEKARRVAAYLRRQAPQTVWAYGNAPADRHMLDLADIATVVHRYRELDAIPSPIDHRPSAVL